MVHRFILLFKRAALIGAALSIGLVALGQEADSSDEGMGGTLIVAEGAEPTTLDPQVTTRRMTVEYALLMVEGLVHFDQNAVPQPMLAERWEVSDDGTVYTFHLRDGVIFHDGSSFGSEDVIASIDRWFNWGNGANMSERITSVEALDEHTVQLTLTEAYPLLLKFMGLPNGNGAFIYPEELVNEAGTDPINEPVGTGPYRMVEWMPGSELRVERFDGYQARSEPQDGFSGDQTAQFEEIVLRLVPDVSVRLAGIQAGDFDMAREMSADQYDQVESDDSLRPRIWPVAPYVIHFDRGGGTTDGEWTGNQGFRQAVNIAMDKDMLAAAIGPAEFYSAEDCNLPAPPSWNTDVCQDEYAQYDPELARQMLEDIGYDGEELVFATVPSRPIYFNAAQMAVQMMRDVGINVTIAPVDAATLLDWRVQADKWDLLSGGHSQKADPTLWSPFRTDYAGWNGAYPDELEQMMIALADEPVEAERIKLWEEVTEFWWDYVPMLKTADAMTMNVERQRLEGTEGNRVLSYINLGMGHFEAP